MKDILIITGPTAIGKSAYAIEQATKLNGEIISADSMQIYRHMDIGTAKPSKEEMSLVPHYLIDIIDPDEPFSVADFIQHFKAAKATIEAKGKLPIIVGGTGLYLNALLRGFGLPIVPPQLRLRKELREEAEKLGGQVLHERLQKLDAITAARLHPNDHFRVIRALEVVMTTGRPIAEQQKRGEPLIGGPYRLLCLTAERELIYTRINERVDKMLKAGLILEVQNLLAMGYNKNINAFKALGYKETIEYLDGQHTEDELAELIKQKTRNFAKRQLTWFRSFKNIEWVTI